MDSRLKVLIVGGSITGLSLALMLERVGIDFLLLEAHVDIAPEVGASIGLCPNGLRILDQLGCYDSLQEKSQNHIVNNSWYGTLDGRKVKEFEGLGGAVIERHGYPLSFIDRRMLLQHLYDSLRQKHKVLTGKRVVSIIKSDNVAVMIRTEDGSSYTGDVLVGADGIHSRVRREMARLDPAHDYIESASLHAHWACLFGISRNVPGIAKGDVGYVFGNRFSYLLGDGPGDRSYFFLTKRLQKRAFGSDIPRFSDKDKEAFVKPHLDDQITSGLRFRDMYDKRMTSVLVPLEEIVYKRWHHSRIIAIGDSSSKMLPITGQGGNSAIENAAVLTNNLFDCLKASPQNKPTVEQLDIAFEKVQELRTPRLQKFVTIASQRQALDALLTPEIKEFALTQMPQLGAEVILRGFQKEFGQAASLNMLPVPYRPRTVPYADEQPQENSKKGDIVAKL